MEILNSAYESWNILSEKEKIFKVFEHIESECKNNTERELVMAMEFLKFINIRLKDKGIKTIFFFDNIDKLPPAAQRNIFSRILFLNEISNITKIITLRRSSKAKFDKLISKAAKPIFQNRAQYVYSHIYHHHTKLLTYQPIILKVNHS